MNLKCKNNKAKIKEIEKVAKVLGIVAEKNRLKILCLLKKREQCVCEIWQKLDLPQNLVSHHLKILKDAGFIKSKKQGLKAIYSINKKVVKRYLKTLSKYL